MMHSTDTQAPISTTQNLIRLRIMIFAHKAAPTPVVISDSDDSSGTSPLPHPDRGNAAVTGYGYQIVVLWDEWFAMVVQVAEVQNHPSIALIEGLEWAIRLL
jgi:hypothetical protein